MPSSFDTRKWSRPEGLDARALNVAAAMAGAAIVGGVMSSQAQSSAANKAADAQTQSAQMGIDEQRRQFDTVRGLLQPYAAAGTPALGQQLDLAGANGADAQQSAISALQQMPGFQSQLRLGENRILANASATGGLRGGNTQAALAYFAPQLLASTINDQYARLGGLTSLGENAAAGVGNAGMATGNNVTQLLQGIGAAQGGAALVGGKAMSNLASTFAGGLGIYRGAGGTFGGIPAPDAVMPPNPYFGNGLGGGFISDGIPMTGIA